MAPYVISRRGDSIVLPPADTNGGFHPLSDWDVARDAIDRLREQTLRRAAPDESQVLVECALIHRSENRHNPNAISVVSPDTLGHDVQQRHLVYLRDGYLFRVGETNLPDLISLARFTRGQLICSGAFRPDAAGFALRLPHPDLLNDAITAFLKQEGVYSPPKLPMHLEPSSQTSSVLKHAWTFDSPREDVGKLQLSTSAQAEPWRMLIVCCASNHRWLGTVQRSLLLLNDERDRTALLDELAIAGVSVKQPKDTPSLGGEDVSDHECKIPNLQARPTPRALMIRGRESEGGGHSTTIALYNPRTKKLWVEDSRLVTVASSYAGRIGLQVDEIGLPSRPWQLDPEIPWHLLKDCSRPSQQHMGYTPDVCLLESVHDLLPPSVYGRRPIRWLDTPSEATHSREPLNALRLHELHALERAELFGEHALEGELSACRLCGQPALGLSVSWCAATLYYCQGCLVNAASGLMLDTFVAARALRLLADLEFGGSPMMEPELSFLHVRRGSLVDARVVDQMLLLRFALRRGQGSWTRLLEDAGLGGEGIRFSRGTVIRARDGHRCLSLLEKAVCDYLHLREIKHEREPYYPSDKELNPRGRMRADWILEDGTLVELWGMPKDAAYAGKMLQKRRLAARHGLRLLELTDADVSHLPERFKDWCPAWHD